MWPWSCITRGCLWSLKSPPQAQSFSHPPSPGPVGQAQTLSCRPSHACLTAAPCHDGHGPTLPNCKPPINGFLFWVAPVMAPPHTNRTVTTAGSEVMHNQDPLSSSLEISVAFPARWELRSLPRMKLYCASWAFLIFLFKVQPGSRSVSAMNLASWNCCRT